MAAESAGDPICGVGGGELTVEEQRCELNRGVGEAAVRGIGSVTAQMLRNPCSTMRAEECDSGGSSGEVSCLSIRPIVVCCPKPVPRQEILSCGGEIRDGTQTGANTRSPLTQRDEERVRVIRRQLGSKIAGKIGKRVAGGHAFSNFPR